MKLGKKRVIAISIISVLLIAYNLITAGKTFKCSDKRDFTKGICVVLDEDRFPDYMLSDFKLYVIFPEKRFFFYGYSIAWDHRFFRPDRRYGLSVSTSNWSSLAKVLHKPIVLEEDSGYEHYYRITNSQYPITMQCRRLPPKSTACDINVEVGETFLVKFGGLSINEPINPDEILAMLVEFQSEFVSPFDFVLLY